MATTHPTTRKPGRPAIGTPINLRLPPILAAAVEAERNRLERERRDGMPVTLNDAVREVLGRALLSKAKR